MRKISTVKFLENCKGTLYDINVMRSLCGEGDTVADPSYESLYSMNFRKKLDINYCLYGYSTSSAEGGKSVSKIPDCLYWVIISYYDFDAERIEFKFIGVNSYADAEDVFKNSLDYFGVKSMHHALLKLSADGLYDETAFELSADEMFYSHITGDEDVFVGMENRSRDDKISWLKSVMEEL